MSRELNTSLVFLFFFKNKYNFHRVGSELSVPAAPPLVFPESLSNSLRLTQRRSSAVECNQITEASARRCEEIKDEETWSFRISECRRRLQKHPPPG